MLFAIRHFLSGFHFLVASCINLAIGILRPRNRDNSRIFDRVYSLLGIRNMLALMERCREQMVAHIAQLGAQAAQPHPLCF